MVASHTLILSHPADQPDMTSSDLPSQPAKHATKRPNLRLTWLSTTDRALPTIVPERCAEFATIRS